MSAASLPTPRFHVPALSQVHTLTQSVSSPALHPTLLPISALTLAHALRVSYATCQVQGGPRKVSLVQSVALVWLLLFGGWSLLRVGLGQSWPLFEPGVQSTALVYGAVHVVAVLAGFQSAMLKTAARHPTSFGLALDIFCNFVDAICRTDGIISLGVEPVRGHASFLTPLLTSAIIGGGGPLLIGLLNLDNSEWRLQTPTWLKNPSGLLAIDIWSASLVGLIYRATAEEARPGSLFPQGLLGPASSVAPSTAAGRALLSHSEAKMLCSAILFALLTVNRLRADVVSAPKSPSKAVAASETSKKGKKGSTAVQRRPTAGSTASPLIWVALLAPVGLWLAQSLLAGSSSEGILSGLNPSSKVLFLLAHPDDEVMFFSPLINALLTLLPAASIFGISVSVGQAGGSAQDLGATRARELVAAYGAFDVPASNVVAIDDAALPDGMTETWQTEAIVQAVRNATRSGATSARWPTQFDAIVTFDSAGISNHPNHAGVADAASSVASLFAAEGRRPAVWRLRSVPLYQKYGSLPHAILARIWSTRSMFPHQRHDCAYVLAAPGQYMRSLAAMRAHASQLVWFRYGWWTLSSYVFGGELCRDASE